jgi:hypothetical protein
MPLASVSFFNKIEEVKSPNEVNAVVGSTTATVTNWVDCISDRKISR